MASYLPFSLSLLSTIPYQLNLGSSKNLARKTSSITRLEEIWIDNVHRYFESKEDDEIDGRAISIYDVPKTLKNLNQEAYTPQLVALGPYHHWREDLHEMERYKLIAARKAQSMFKTVSFEELVGELGKVQHKIRAYYHKYLIMKGETLAWMMAIDGLFLLQFLHIFVNRNDSVLATSARMSFLVDSKERKHGYNSMLKDIMMLENQIPLYVIKKILKVQSPRLKLVDNMLPKMILGFCNEIKLFKLKEINYDQINQKILKRSHLLGILYFLTVPMCEDSQGKPTYEDSQDSDEKCRVRYENGVKKGCFSIDDESGQSTKVFKTLWEQLFTSCSKMMNGPLKIIQVVGKTATNVAPYMGGLSEKGSSKSEDGQTKAPQVEEIKIPSVTRLVNFGVEFVSTNGGLSTIKFNPKTHKFYLPIVTLDMNSEVILRNLVAYEATTISGPLVLARYTELMNGIIDTAEDARILVEKGIIKKGQLKCQEVADLWNGMSKAIRPCEVKFIDDAIEEVNKYYGSTKTVRFIRASKAYVSSSWRVLVILATFLVIGLMFIQSLCTVYDCHRTFNLGPKS